ncbi:aminotransferase class I/II-fold pyridoxal phosphate-dependent enzyme [Aureimonas flava]|uniref:Histidinol-phosphate aminotransferase n=1 Tax=Aureimonas flava TaxID=2320271 RepID=A0A3A1WLY9_9HYPH|nr:histidinol-phosphate transaminase [Aureimonas flava]RIY02566.1 aminotransferase class I/II-fold pyridoxal phosphate-dependent enzyme [Aureimonas flava]
MLLDTVSPMPHLARVPPYAAAEKPAGDGGRPVILSQNELATAPSPRAVEAAAATLAGSNRYPDSDCEALCAAIAARHGLRADRVLCTPGSMTLLGTLVRSYAGAGDEVVITRHGYGYFRTVIQLAGATPVVAPETELHADVDAILARVTERTRIVLLANPNNPTGTMIPWSEVLRLHAGLREDILLVLDAAYAEFVARPDFRAGSDLVDASRNTVMIRTFSKIYGLAGMRVGWGYFPAAIADLLRRVTPPSSVSSQAQAAAIAALADRDHTRATFEAVSRERQRLAAALGVLGLAGPPSEANFVLADFGSPERAKRAHAFLTRRGIHLRPVASADLPQHLRITIGTAAEHEEVLGALRAFLDRPA